MHNLYIKTWFCKNMVFSVQNRLKSWVIQPTTHDGTMVGPINIAWSIKDTS